MLDREAIRISAPPVRSSLHGEPQVVDAWEVCENAGMRWAAVFLLSTIACSERLEVELHPQDNDKAVIIVIEDSEGLRAFGQDLGTDASETLTQPYLEEALVQILYLEETLDDHGLTAGQLEFKAGGISLPAPSHQEVWSASADEPDLNRSIRHDFRVAHSRCETFDFVQGTLHQLNSLELAPGKTVNIEDLPPGRRSLWITEGERRIGLEVLSDFGTFVARAADDAVWTFGFAGLARSRIEATQDGYRLPIGEKYPLDGFLSSCTFGPFETWACGVDHEDAVYFSGPAGPMGRGRTEEPCLDPYWLTEDCIACLHSNNLVEVCRDDLMARPTTELTARGALRPFRGFGGRLGFVDDDGTVLVRLSEGIWHEEARLSEFGPESAFVAFFGGFHYSTGTTIETVIRGRGRCRSLDHPAPNGSFQNMYHSGNAFILEVDSGSDRRVFSPRWDDPT